MVGGGKIRVTEDSFGQVPTPQGSLPVKRFTLSNGTGGEVQVINYGATITSIKVPDRDGQLGDVVMGFDNIQGYLDVSNRYLGATIGRFGNRIKEGKFTLEDGKSYNLTINNGPNHLHGGHQGFDKRMWEARVDDDAVVMSYVSQDGEEGYPGHLLVNVRFEWTRCHELIISYQATTTKPTPINLTNHSYFNLAGHGAGPGLEGHFVQLNADSYTPVDANLIPTGEIKSVEGTMYDLQKPGQSLAALLKKFPPGPNGYDNNFCVNRDSKKTGIQLVASVEESGSGRGLTIHSDQPGIQFYTANFLPDEAAQEAGLVGKGGAVYWKHGAMCMETQNYPDAINHPNFPNGVLLPGEVYNHRAHFKFFTTVKST
ncbi:galactose mutarotase [Folsomia candida]|uniref:Aldose 1-epimerase n=1 Tax=Folsomia candida TaxID=158441 RepID=A0A226DD55_FOLCA|nr:galactose mutarotase [Folsomia candida]OXA42764.1 Aldose 1-epimerase [Folsomia candida]